MILVDRAMREGSTRPNAACQWCMLGHKDPRGWLMAFVCGDMVAELTRKGLRVLGYLQPSQAEDDTRVPRPPSRHHPIHDSG